MLSYEKPEVLGVTAAVEAVQGFTKCTQTHPDGRNPSEHDATIGAYEADE
jgi:hypothetical protein